MSYNEDKLLEQIINQFNILVKENNISNYDYFKQSKLTYNEEKKLHIDLIVKINNIELYFEFSENFDVSSATNFLEISKILHKNNRYFILCNNINSLQLKISDDTFIEYHNIFELYQFVKRQIKNIIKDKPILKNELCKIIFSSVAETLNIETNNPKLNKVIQLLKLDLFEKHLNFDHDNNYYYFTDNFLDKENFENKFFDCLLENLDIGNKFYRYGDLGLGFFTIKDSNCRFSGIPGMNDISEIGYLENYIDESYIPLNTPQEVEKINNKFILCSSSLQDDLNQWRLYGDDCKGVSIEFEIVKNLPNFFIKKISYGINREGINFHLELELIKLIQQEFYSILGVELRFKTLNVWKHFFKSFEYQPEKEVRVLYINIDSNIKWNLTYSHNILNPFIEFKLHEIPLKINNILFGTKCSETDINIKQFRYLASISEDVDIKNITFGKSKIKNYR